MSRKVLLLGATGFLGKRIALRLRKDGISFIPVSRSLGTDLRDYAQFRRIFETNRGIDTILHAATFIGGIKFGLDHPGEIYYNNSLINTYLFELARDFAVRRIVNPISNCSYPRDIYPEFREELWWQGPLDESVMVYGFIRKGSWVQSWAYHRQYGLETINLIVPNMYGPEDHFDEVRSHALGALVMKVVRACESSKPEVVVWGSGKPIREWLYVDDCVDAMMRAIDVDHTSEPINIGVGSGVSIRELAEMIQREAGYRGKLVFDASFPDGAPYKVMNIDKCKRLFGWSPQTILKDGIAATVSWYRTHGLGRQH
jgi:GDP-L-fucose synthase